MTRSFVVLLLVLVLIGAAGALLCSCGTDDETPAIPDLAQDPEAVLADYVGDSADALPGIAVSVIKGGESVYRNVAGVRKLGTSDPVKVDDAFHIGSDTKAMTAVLCGVLIDRGLLSFDTTIGEVLGAGGDPAGRPEGRDHAVGAGTGARKGARLSPFAVGRAVARDTARGRGARPARTRTAPAVPDTGDALTRALATGVIGKSTARNNSAVAFAQ